MIHDGGLHITVAVRGHLPDGSTLAYHVERESRDGGSVLTSVWKQVIARCGDLHELRDIDGATQARRGI